MKDITKHYTNGELTVVWKPALCIHSKRCWTGLPGVFDPRRRPWIDMGIGTTETIRQQVDKCPSGALAYFLNAEGESTELITETSETVIEILPDGPLMVYGNLTVKHADGSTEDKHKVIAFCRCGASRNKPYCDGSHLKIGFKDRE